MKKILIFATLTALCLYAAIDIKTLPVNKVKSGDWVTYVKNDLDSMAKDSMSNFTAAVNAIVIKDSLDDARSELKAWAGAEDNSTLAAAFDSITIVLDSCLDYTNDRIEMAFDFIPGKNIFNSTAIVTGYYINNTLGTLTSNANSAITEYIPCLPGKIYTLSGNLNGMINFTRRFYDSDSTYIGFTNNAFASSYSFTTPANCYYFQTTINLKTALPNYSNVQIEEGSTATEYEAFGSAKSAITKDNLRVRYLIDTKIKSELENDSSVASRSWVIRNSQPRRDSMIVITNGDTLIIRTKFDETFDLVQETHIGYNQAFGDNKPFNFYYAWLVDKANTNESYVSLLAGDQKAVHFCGDDACPRRYNSTYVGANHGPDKGILVKSIGHGKTTADVGSEWADNDSTEWFIYNIPNPDSLYVVSENTGTKAKWSFDTSINGNLVHHSKATHTGTITVTTQSSGKWIEPIIKHNTKKIILNEKEITTKNWTVYTGNKLKFVEDYYIANPAASVDSLYAHCGTTDTLFNQGEPDIHIMNTYTWDEFGGCVIANRAYNYYAMTEGYYGVIQSAVLSNYDYDSVYVSVPHTLPYNDGSRTWNLNTNIENMYPLPAPQMSFSSTYWETSTEPPYRVLEFIGNTKDSLIAGFQQGYDISIGSAIPSTRLARSTYALSIFTTGKVYPRLYDNKVAAVAMKYDDCVAYRGYFKPYKYSANAACVQFFETRPDVYMLTLDYYTAIINDKIILPEILNGYKITELDKSSTITMHSSYVDSFSGIFLTTTAAGHGVWKLTKE